MEDPEFLATLVESANAGRHLFHFGMVFCYGGCAFVIVIVFRRPLLDPSGSFLGVVGVH